MATGLDGDNEAGRGGFGPAGGNAGPHPSSNPDSAFERTRPVGGAPDPDRTMMDEPDPDETLPYTPGDSSDGLVPSGPGASDPFAAQVPEPYPPHIPADRPAPVADDAIPTPLDPGPGHGHNGVVIAGRYRLLERLGAGGMGRVWRAHDMSLECDVAVKEVWLPPMLSDAERTDRLARAQREARNAARLRNHPHIVSVHDMVTDQGLPWIVMDLIPSQNLAQIVERFGPLPLEQVVTIGMGVLEALTASHAAGILHRDVKPANVLLTDDARVLLTDFGIAVQESDLTMTSSGMLVGSPEYVAPERARGEASRPASDLFSLGATLYYAAEGRSPFARESAVGVLTAILFEETSDVTRIPQLAPLVRGLLEKDPNRRFDAARTRDELTRLGARAGTGATPAPTPAPMRTLLMPDEAAEAGPANPFLSGSGSGTGGFGGTGGPGGRSGTGGDAAFPVPPPGPVPAQHAAYGPPPTMAANTGPGGTGGSGHLPNGSAPMGPGPMGPGPMGPGPMGPGPMGPGGPAGPPPIGPTGPLAPPPGYFPQPPAKSKTGRNVGLGIGAVLAAGAIVAAIVFATKGGGKDDNVATVNQTSNQPTTARPQANPSGQASSPAGGSASASFPSADLGSAPPAASSSLFDPASLDAKDTDQTPMTIDALLPPSFTDSKGVVYTQTNQWVSDCVTQYESKQLKALLTKYNCTKQAISTYVDKDGKILVDLEVMPLDSSDAAASAFRDMQGVNAFTIDDWGIWCPKPGPGSTICSQGQDTSNAQQYGYIQPTHRYLVHAVSLYINLTSDPAAQDSIKPAATSAAKAGGPQNYAGNQ